MQGFVPQVVSFVPQLVHPREKSLQRYDEHLVLSKFLKGILSFFDVLQYLDYSAFAKSNTNMPSFLAYGSFCRLKHALSPFVQRAQSVFKIFKSNLQRGNNNRKSLCTNSLQRRAGHAFGRLSSTSACKMTHKPHFWPFCKFFTKFWRYTRGKFCFCYQDFASEGEKSERWQVDKVKPPAIEICFGGNNYSCRTPVTS